MRAASYIAIGLALATVANAVAIGAERPSWLLIGTSEDVFRTQAIHIVKYPNGMSDCTEALRHVKLMRPGPAVLITLAPFCTEIQPTFWVE